MSATYMPELPAMLLTYDFYDRAEASAVRAIAGEVADRRPPADRAARAVRARRGAGPSAVGPGRRQPVSVI